MFKYLTAVVILTATVSAHGADPLNDRVIKIASKKIRSHLISKIVEPNQIECERGRRPVTKSALLGIFGSTECEGPIECKHVPGLSAAACRELKVAIDTERSRLMKRLNAEREERERQRVAQFRMNLKRSRHAVLLPARTEGRVEVSRSRRSREVCEAGSPQLDFVITQAGSVVKCRSGGDSSPAAGVFIPVPYRCTTPKGEVFYCHSPKLGPKCTRIWPPID